MFIPIPEPDVSQISTYICPGAFKAISIEVGCGSGNADVSISGEEGQVSVPITKGSGASANVDVSIIRPGWAPEICRLENLDDVLFWKYALVFGRVSNIHIYFENPKGACHWEYSLLQSFFYGPRVMMYPEDGELPFSKQFVYPYDEGQVYNHTSKIRVGEDLTVTWKFKGLPATPARSVYYHGYNITGGRIIGILHPPDSEDRFYSVSVEGKVGYIQATDYYPYEVGDWVSVVFVRNDDEGNPDWSDVNFDAAGIFIVPFIGW